MFKNCVFNVSVDTKKWIKSAGVRAIKTMAQSALAVITVSSTIYEIDVKALVGIVVLSGITSVLTSIVGIPEVESEGK